MRQYGLSKMEFSDVAEGDLDRVVSEITKEFLHSGEGLIKQMLLLKQKQKHKGSTLAIT